MSRPTSLRRSPSTFPSSVMTCLIFLTSSSDRSLTRVSRLTCAFPRMSFERERPMPKMYVSPISTRLLRGRSTPAIRAMFSPCWVLRAACCVLSTQHSALSTQHSFLSLTLLVLRVVADDADHALTADDLALGTNLLD